MSDIEPIDRAIETAVDPATAWRTITEPDLVATWFTDATPLGPVGAPYRLDFGDGSVVEGTVLEVEPGRRFAHSWAWAGGDPAETTRVEWSVNPAADGGSTIRLVHDGWEPAGGRSARDDHDAYWAGYLDDLRDLLDGS